MDTKEINTFLEDEDENAFLFSQKSLKDNKLTISIEDECEFTISRKDGKFTVESADIILEKFITQISEYCSQGKKSITDVLENATEVYSEIFAGEDEDDIDEEDEEEDDSNLFEFSQVQSQEEKDERTKRKKLKNVEDRFLKDQKTKLSKEASSRLLRDYLQLVETNTDKLGWSAAPVGNDLTTWHVKMFNFQGQLAKDMKSLKVDHILFVMTFPENYPRAPPFIRVLKPRFQHLTGHITLGGSICMQLLTPSGWSPANSIESIFVQIRFEIENGKPRLNRSNTSPYSIREAKEAFIRVSTRYGWDK